MFTRSNFKLKQHLRAFKIILFSLMSLAQFTETLGYICKELKFEFRSSHLFTLRVELLATKLFEGKKIYYLKKMYLKYESHFYELNKLFLDSLIQIKT
jgi:hypothetical protein